MLIASDPLQDVDDEEEDSDLSDDDAAEMDGDEGAGMPPFAGLTPPPARCRLSSAAVAAAPRTLVLSSALCQRCVVAW